MGAGPAGSLAAIALARQGFHVDVYERRPEPKLDHVRPVPAWPQTLTQEAEGAIQLHHLHVQDLHEKTWFIPRLTSAGAM